MSNCRFIEWKDNKRGDVNIYINIDINVKLPEISKINMDKINMNEINKIAIEEILNPKLNPKDKYLMELAMQSI